MLRKLSLYVNTLKYLKPIQIYYQLSYTIVSLIYKKPLDFSKNYSPSHKYLTYSFSVENNSYKKSGQFKFLNISHQFENEIDWEFMEYGKLWQYNLTYFDYLNDPTLKPIEGLSLINHFINFQNHLKSSIEPYPTSLRIINWIRFVNRHHIKDARIISAIYIQAQHLTNRLEYHLLGNHLLENGFSLLHAAKFFSDASFYGIAEQILLEQLKEQILADGGHFELSPMYHQIIFSRVLESIDLLKSNYQEADKELLALLYEKAAKMLNWLENITFDNGDIPLFNDSANGIAPTTHQLQLFAQKLGITHSPSELNQSGYRKFKKQNYEAIIDVGPVGPSYQPGHAHADMLNLVVYINKQPFLVETGTSTYQISERRHLERSTISHNTVVVDNENQSQIWSGFRIAKRATMKIIKENSEMVLAQHNGYKGQIHQRKADFLVNQINITDYVIGNAKIACAHWHFHPNIKIELEGNKLLFAEGQIIFENCENIFIEDYQYSTAFNQLSLSKKIVVGFRNMLKTRLIFS